jgi:hypothetical protein
VVKEKVETVLHSAAVRDFFYLQLQLQLSTETTRYRQDFKMNDVISLWLDKKEI